MSTKDQAWAERVGREAVALGMPSFQCAKVLQTGLMERRPRGYLGTDWLGNAPDFRDRLTELACIAWVEDVAREVYGDAITITHRATPGEWVEIVVVAHGDRTALRTDIVKAKECKGTLAEACIAAVRAMKGGE